MITPSEVRYATSSDGGAIAFQVAGDGPVVLYAAGMITQLAVFWGFPYFYAPYLERAASFSRLITFDHRGAGLSDPLPADGMPIDLQVDDMVAVLDAADVERAVICGELHAGPSAIRMAAEHPDRVAARFLNMTYARQSRTDDYPCGYTDAELDEFVDGIVSGWGTGQFFALWQPDVLLDQGMLEEIAQFERLAASPARARALLNLWRRNDARADLERLAGVRTCVVHDRDNFAIPTEHGRFLAEHIPGAEYHEYPSAEELSAFESAQVQAELLAQFVTGSRANAQAERVLGVLVFVDVVESTQRATRTGDASWRADIEAFRRAALDALDPVGGRLVNTRGDDLFALCRTVASALIVVRTLRAQARRLGFEIRAGVHIADVDDTGDDVLGVGVHVAARVAAVAGPGEILTTEAVRTAALGGNEQLTDAGAHELKGIPGEWRLASVVEPDDQ